MLLPHKTITMPLRFSHDRSDLIQEAKNYLGIHITADVWWDMHITSICAKSKKLLGVLNRSSMYSSVDPAFLCLLYTQDSYVSNNGIYMLDVTVY